jgi:hypothetical protein
MSPQVPPGPQTPREPTRTSEKLSKSLPERLKEVRKAHPKSEIELWAEDEARLGLKPWG